MKLGSKLFQFLSRHGFISEESVDFGCGLEVVFRKVIAGTFHSVLLFTLETLSVCYHRLLKLRLICELLPVKFCQKGLNLLFMLVLVVSKFFKMCLLCDCKLTSKLCLSVLELFCMQLIDSGN